MLRGSDASDAEAEARQLALGPPNELAVLAALSDADVIDVSGAEPIFDLLDTNGDGRLSAEELRQGVRSDAVVHYVRETGNAILKGLLRDRRGVGRALQEIDDSSGPFVSRRGWKRFVQAMAVERVRHLREMGLVKGRCYWGKGLDDVQTTPSLFKWFSPLGAAWKSRAATSRTFGSTRGTTTRPSFVSGPRTTTRPCVEINQCVGMGEALAASRLVHGVEAYAILGGGPSPPAQRRAALDVAEQLRAQRANNGRLHLRAFVDPGGAALVFVGVPVRALRAARPQAGNGVQMHAEDARGARPRRRAAPRLLAVGFLVLEAMRLDGVSTGPRATRPVAAGVESKQCVGLTKCGRGRGLVGRWSWSYVIWFPVKLCVQFNLCVGAPPPWLRPLKIGRWAAERRRAARNALSFGDADDDLDDVEEPWRVFEQA